MIPKTIEQPVAAPLPVDTRLGRYQLTRVLSQDNLAILYEAQDTSLQRAVTIKEYMPAQLATRSEGSIVYPFTSRHAKTFELGRQSFVGEARLLAQLRHPALLEVLHFWEQNGTAYWATPCYEGRTLQQVIDKQGSLITRQWLQQTISPLLDALEHMHAADCYHRDVSADNILILNDGRALLLDLGTVRRAVGDSEQALTVMLKPGYAPIEQYLNDPTMRHGPWTDIYAIGACIYACMQGYPPNDAPRRIEKDRLSLSLSRLRGVYSDNLIEVVEWCMALDPLSRPQSVFALQKELSREGERRYTKLTVAEKMRLQLDTLVSDAKKNVQKLGEATDLGVKPK
ncbi:MAG: serine/threonine protein kinase [Burkholderiales bacterium]|nr:serine/threonine protein kinase [Burkholderiales bacterium]